ncbi:hypothetical protein [Variovorax sp. YR266]|uniref:hypothetical protein n=1 Tax=Variovorax sp. YR266 TaxID=1884386 RepID=UPI0015A08757|nr:hypothetical protein [Variovorax sp. YR266]
MGTGTVALTPWAVVSTKAQGGMQAWAVSDLNATELRHFASLLRERGAALSK